MITITVTIEEEESGGVSVGTKTMSIATRKEAIYATVIINAIRNSAQEISQGPPEKRKDFNVIKPIGDG